LKNLRKLKRLLFFTFSFLGCFTSPAQSKTKNVIIVTLDGFRWQEIFGGADSALIANSSYNADTALCKSMYWAATTTQRRERLLPFFWNVIGKQGQLYGNRWLQNSVAVKNIYKFSYPGYNEILTGYPDTRLIPNTPVENQNINLLEFLNTKPGFAGKVVAFSSWNIIPFILNERRSHIPVNGGYESLPEYDATAALINTVQSSINSKGHTRYDQLTYLSARNYLQSQHPRVAFISLGEMDESAHGKHYDLYLQNAATADRMLAELWYLIQTDPFYRDQTMLLITTDHGRGDTPKGWHNHGALTRGSGATWLGMIGPDILPLGEITGGQKIFNSQIAATICQLLGEKFEANHSVGKAMSLPGESMGITNE
jgi:hypothetical protein